MRGRDHDCRHRSGKHLHRQIEVPEPELDLESSERIIVAADKHDDRGPGHVTRLYPGSNANYRLRCFALPIVVHYLPEHEKGPKR